MDKQDKGVSDGRNGIPKIVLVMKKPDALLEKLEGKELRRYNDVDQLRVAIGTIAKHLYEVSSDNKRPYRNRGGLRSIERFSADRDTEGPIELPKNECGKFRSVITQGNRIPEATLKKFKIALRKVYVLENNELRKLPEDTLNSIIETIDRLEKLQPQPYKKVSYSEDGSRKTAVSSAGIKQLLGGVLQPSTSHQESIGGRKQEEDKTGGITR